jgi:hypothetical protein
MQITPGLRVTSSKIGKGFTAVLGFDRSKLVPWIEDAEAAILLRSRSLSKAPATSRKEQKAITRALHILGLLREGGQEL